jgi:cation transporter-like permease
MRSMLLATAALIVTYPALAQTAAPSGSPATTATATSCKAQATEKKLAGAAMNSFMKKCQTDATSACSTQASERKLAGAAKTSFTKKCVTDAVGTT